MPTRDRQPIVSVVDDDPITRLLIKSILDKHGVESALFEEARAFLQSDRIDAPGCVLLDLHMQDVDGLAVQRELHARSSTLPVVVISATADPRTAVDAMRLEAIEFVFKPIDPDHLIKVVQSALELDVLRRNQREHARLIVGRFQTLSGREREVMKLVVEGMPNKQIARTLNLSEKTIEAHRSSVMRKMEADSLPDLVRASIVCDGESDSRQASGGDGRA